MQDLQYIDIGFIQIDDRRGVKKLLRILQVFGPGLKNKFKTQLASKEIYSEDWGVDLDLIGMLEYDKPTSKNTRPLLFAASNKEGDTEARKIGSAIFVDTSRYPVSIRTWRVNFFLGTKFNSRYRKYQIMINKELRQEVQRTMLPMEHRGLQTLEAKTAYFDLIKDPGIEDLDLDGLGKMFSLREKAKNYLLFDRQKAETEKIEVPPATTAEEEEGVETSPSSATAIAESIVKEQEESVERENERENVVHQALTNLEITAHKCRVAIVTFLYNRVYVDQQNTVTRPIILEYMLENFQWSRSTVYRHFQKLERSGFLKDLPGQNTTQEFKIVGFDHRIEAAIKELCESRGWKFGGKRLTG